MPKPSATEPSTHAHQFDDAAQQRDAATFGMWVFLATEVLFFGGMFLGYTAYRLAYPAAFAEASRHTLIAFGGTNTAVLLISSVTMAFAVRAAREQRRTALALRLFATAGLGVLFLGIKGCEYAREISEHLLPGSAFHFPQPYATHAQMFFYLYFLMTGVHALHVTIGVILIAIFGFARGAPAHSRGMIPRSICSGFTGTSSISCGSFYSHSSILWGGTHEPNSGEQKISVHRRRAAWPACAHHRRCLREPRAFQHHRCDDHLRRKSSDHCCIFHGNS